MKVGVITFHRANNYGAILQTWALQKVLRDLKVDTGVINYHPEAIDRLYDPMMCRKGLSRQIKRFQQFLRNRDSLKRYNKFIYFLDKNINLIGDFHTYKELEKAKLGLDAYIVGSDQVWNDSHTGGYDPAFFLQFAEPGKKRISYAASIGRDYFNPRFKEQFRQGLLGFDAISVREPSLLGAVKELVDKKVSVVLDPTLLLDRGDYDEIKGNSWINEKYILIYMIEKNEQLITLANRISVALGIPVIQRRPAGALRNELPPFYTADAGDFLGLMESAEYVITNSFHGTVFSILYERPFLSMLHSDTGNRTADLLKGLNLQSHILYDIKDFKDFNMFRIENPERLRSSIQEQKKESLQYLRGALNLNDIM